MKKLNFHALYLLSFLFFNNCFGFSLTNNRVVKTVREHKKKIIASIIVSGYILMAYRTNKNFYYLYKEYLDCKIPDQINAQANKLAQISKSWFSIPTHRNIIINEIQKKPENFSQWCIRGHKLYDGSKVLFHTYYKVSNDTIN